MKPQDMDLFVVEWRLSSEGGRFFSLFLHSTQISGFNWLWNYKSADVAFRYHLEDLRHQYQQAWMSSSYCRIRMQCRFLPASDTTHSAGKNFPPMKVPSSPHLIKYPLLRFILQPLSICQLRRFHRLFMAWRIEQGKALQKWRVMKQFYGDDCSLLQTLPSSSYFHIEWLYRESKMMRPPDRATKWFGALPTWR